MNSFLFNNDTCINGWNAMMHYGALQNKFYLFKPPCK